MKPAKKTTTEKIILPMWPLPGPTMKTFLRHHSGHLRTRSTQWQVFGDDFARKSLRVRVNFLHEPVLLVKSATLVGILRPKTSDEQNGKQDQAEQNRVAFCPGHVQLPSS